MGRLRKVARFTFSIGGTDGLSPVRRESSAEEAARKTHALLAQQVELMGGTPPPAAPDPYRPAHERAMDDVAEIGRQVTERNERLAARLREQAEARAARRRP
jgi:hypothetical protein